MRDLHLWRTLQQFPASSRDSSSAAALPILDSLTELSRLPLFERMPFLGLLLPLLNDPRPEVRSAVLLALGGAHGRPALMHIINGLGDPEVSVRLAAVESLRRSLLGFDGERWVHVLFHPDPLVRNAALDEKAEFPAPILYKLYLLSDPECRELVSQQLHSLTPAVSSLPMLFEYVRQKVLSPSLGRTICSRLTWDQWAEYLEPHLPRTADISSALLDTLNPTWPDRLDTNYIPDRLDLMFHLFWEDDPPEETGQPTVGPASRAGLSDSLRESPGAARLAAPTPSQRFFQMLIDTALAEGEPFRQWIVFTLTGVGASRKSWPQLAVEACALFFSPFLTSSWVPLEARKRAIRGLYRFAGRVKRQTPDLVEKAIRSELCQYPSGRLDLWAVGGVLRLLAGNPYQQLLQWVSLDEITESFHADPEPSIPFLTLSDNSPQGRKYLIDQLCLKASDRCNCWPG